MHSDENPSTCMQSEMYDPRRNVLSITCPIDGELIKLHILFSDLLYFNLLKTNNYILNIYAKLKLISNYYLIEFQHFF